MLGPEPSEIQMDLLGPVLVAKPGNSGLGCRTAIKGDGLGCRTVIKAPVSGAEPAIEQPEHVQLGEMRTGLVAVQQRQQYQQQYYQYDAFHKHLVMLSFLTLFGSRFESDPWSTIVSRLGAFVRDLEVTVNRHG